ncbi:uncharacterized protein [Branchiostoma lanceolatum]|uniref:uncharacterized protein n=1 Tax=Branchiostoma lanceolatum TaxID=7740 RepID=UPI0034533EDA
MLTHKVSNTHRRTSSRFIHIPRHLNMAEAAEPLQEIQVKPEEISEEKPTDNLQETSQGESQETQQQPKASGVGGGLFDLIKKLKGSEGKSKSKDEANGQSDKYAKKMIEKAKKKKPEKPAKDRGGWEDFLN